MVGTDEGRVAIRPVASRPRRLADASIDLLPHSPARIAKLFASGLGVQDIMGNEDGAKRD